MRPDDEDEWWRNGLSDEHLNALETPAPATLGPQTSRTAVQRLCTALLQVKQWQKQDLSLLDSCVLQAVAIWRSLRSSRDPKADALLKDLDHTALSIAELSLRLQLPRWGGKSALGLDGDGHDVEVRRLLRAVSYQIESTIEDFLQIFVRRYLRKTSPLRKTLDSPSTTGHMTGNHFLLVSGAMRTAQMALLEGCEAMPRRLAQVHFLVACHCLGQDLKDAMECCAYDETLEEDFKAALLILVPTRGDPSNAYEDIHPWPLNSASKTCQSKGTGVHKE